MREETFIEHREPDFDSYDDINENSDDYETIEPENPYEDDDGGWDPSIG
jgi:hypothetical protein